MRRQQSKFSQPEDRRSGGLLGSRIGTLLKSSSDSALTLCSRKVQGHGSGCEVIIASPFIFIPSLAIRTPETHDTDTR